MLILFNQMIELLPVSQNYNIKRSTSLAMAVYMNIYFLKIKVSLNRPKKPMKSTRSRRPTVVILDFIIILWVRWMIIGKSMIETNVIHNLQKNVGEL